MKSPALLVVHGIGTQKPGDTLLQCVRGLLSVCPEAKLLDFAAQPLQPDSITAHGLDFVRIETGGIAIRLYEVYWADLLPDAAVEGSFSKFDFEETTWFPYLNWRAGLLPRSEYPAALVYARTAQLWLLQAGMSMGLELISSKGKIRSLVLDQTAADVWNYVHSLAGELRAGSPLTGCSERVLDRFEAAWLRATGDEPGEQVHAIAHSLGSVVAYHAMVRRLPPNAITRLTTIGSPLEKVRFMWAKLFPPTFRWTCEWVNFHTPSDPVSGKLKRFDADERTRIRNIRIWGVGGLGEAHVGYFRHPRVMAPLAEALGATATPARSAPLAWFRRRAIDIAVPIATLLFVAGGAALLIAFFYLVAWIAAALLDYPLRLVAPSFARKVGRVYRTIAFYIAMPLWLVFLTKDGYSRAASRHRRHWQ